MRNKLSLKFPVLFFLENFSNYKLNFAYLEKYYIHYIFVEENTCHNLFKYYY